MKKDKSRAPKGKRAAKHVPVGGLGEPPEEGLSMDPDELGPGFLRHATEQDNFESARATAREFAPTVEPPSDDAPREGGTPGGNLWERTVHEAAEREVEGAQQERPFSARARRRGTAPRGTE